MLRAGYLRIRKNSAASYSLLSIDSQENTGLFKKMETSSLKEL